MLSDEVQDWGRERLEQLVTWSLFCLEGIKFTEKDNKLRLSFRSKGDFSVNELTRSHFNGGGHRNAAGGKSSEKLDELIVRLKSVMENYREQLNYTIEI